MYILRIELFWLGKHLFRINTIIKRCTYLVFNFFTYRSLCKVGHLRFFSPCVPRSFCIFYVIRIAAPFPSTFDYGVRVSKTSNFLSWRCNFLSEKIVFIAVQYRKWQIVLFMWHNIQLVQLRNVTLSNNSYVCKKVES